MIDFMEMLNDQYNSLVREASNRATSHHRVIQIRQQLTSIRRIKQQLKRGAMIK